MGKKDKTSLKKKVDASWTVNSSPTARNLSKNQLGAVIFGCKYHTFTECLKNKLFGLPAAHYAYVKNITPGLALFLFNYSDRKLHGIFEAVSCGQMNMDQYAWTTSEGSNLTPYAAQVRMDSRVKCRPLSEDEFKPIIEKNYYAERLFWFELDKAQTHRLIQLFLSSPLPEKMPRPPKAPKQMNMFDVLSSSDINVAVNEEFENLDSWSYSGAEMKLEGDNAYASVLVTTHDSATDKKWTDLFRDSSSSRNEISKPPSEAWPDAANVESDSQLVDNWEEHALVEHDPQEMYENVEPHLQCHELDSERLDQWGVPCSDNMTFYDKEVCESETSDSKIQSDTTDGACLENHNALCGGGVDSTDRALFENHNALCGGGVLTDTQSSDYESVISKMAQEVEGLKLSQLKQRLKMDSLEQELVHSKLEIVQLKKRCHILESMGSFASDQNNVKDCDTSEEYVLIVGGLDGRNSWLSDLSMYSPLQDKVVSLCPMTFPRSSASVAKLNGELYIFGGICDGVWYNTVESYNPVINQWIQRPSLSKKKGSMAGASLYETIFAMGGGNGFECFSEVELLDLNIGSWMSTQSMLEKRMGAAAAHMNGALYVAGGFDGKEYLRSVERFDPRQHAWSRIASMNSKRGSHSLVAFKEELYALGGYDGGSVVSTVEVFDPRIGSWMMEEPMTASRVDFGSFVFGGKIYVIGGRKDAEVLDVIECYEPGSGWRVIGNHKFGKRSSFSALVI